MIFFNKHIVLITLSFNLFVSSYSQCPPSIDTDFASAGCTTGRGAGPVDQGWVSYDGAGTMTETSTCLEFGGSSCGASQANSPITPTCDFCYSFDYTVDLSSDPDCPGGATCTSDGFTFTFLQQDSGGANTCGQEACQFGGACSPGGGQGALGANSFGFEGVEAFVIEVDLFDNGGGDVPGGCSSGTSINAFNWYEGAITDVANDCIDGSYETLGGSQTSTWTFCYDATNNEMRIYGDGALEATVSVDLSTMFTPLDDCAGGTLYNLLPTFSTSNEAGVTSSFCNFAMVPEPMGVLTNSFKGMAKENQIELTWFEDADYVVEYEVEKSIDGENFTLLSKVPVSSHGSKYLVYDDAPIEGSNYYRIKQIEFTGIESFVPKIVVDYSPKSNYKIIQLGNQIDITSSDKTTTQVRVFDINGKLIKESNFNSKFESILLNEYKNGMYFINVSSENESVSKKILILND